MYVYSIYTYDIYPPLARAQDDALWQCKTFAAFTVLPALCPGTKEAIEALHSGDCLRAVPRLFSSSKEGKNPRAMAQKIPFFACCPDSWWQNKAMHVEAHHGEVARLLLQSLRGPSFPGYLQNVGRLQGSRALSNHSKGIVATASIIIKRTFSAGKARFMVDRCAFTASYSQLSPTATGEPKKRVVQAVFSRFSPVKSHPYGRSHRRLAGEPAGAGL